MPRRRRKAGLALLSLLGVLAPACALVDPCENFDVAESHDNIAVASNSGGSLDRFQGDSGRFVREGKGMAFLNYVENAKIDRVDVEFFATSTSFQSRTWSLTFILDDENVSTLLSYANIGVQLEAATSGTVRSAIDTKHTLVQVCNARVPGPVRWSGALRVQHPRVCPARFGA